MIGLSSPAVVVECAWLPLAVIAMVPILASLAATAVPTSQAAGIQPAVAIRVVD
ncbi:MAG TPA: hypothetical protein VM848_19725 [Acidimicrobiia bacterium]|nr:hypothetical protein [Acidimicrobiia bacterium]